MYEKVDDAVRGCLPLLSYMYFVFHVCHDEHF